MRICLRIVLFISEVWIALVFIKTMNNYRIYFPSAVTNRHIFQAFLTYLMIFMLVVGSFINHIVEDGMLIYTLLTDGLDRYVMSEYEGTSEW